MKERPKPSRPETLIVTDRNMTWAFVTLILGLFVIVGSSSADTLASDNVIDSTITESEVQVLAEPGTSDSQKAGPRLYPISPERQAKLAAYSEFRNIWRFVSYARDIGILLLILFAGWSAKLRDLASKIKPKFLAIWLFLVLYLLLDYVLSLPFSIYRGFIVESDFGFMNQTFVEWWGEGLLSLLISMIIGIIPVWSLYWVIGKFKRWWLVFSIGAIPFAILMIVIVPVVISPLFNDFEPIKDKAVEAELLTLASEAGIEDADVFQVNASKQSSKINAYVTGLLGSKRIVLYDTMINNFTLDEIRFVMAHEMGHYVKNHVWWGTLMTIAYICFLLWLMNRLIHPVIKRFRDRFGFDRLGDMASLPLVLLFVTVLMLLFAPVSNSVSRYMEHSCDVYGMDVSGVSGETAATSFDKLSVYNLADPDPHPLVEFWFYSHPSLKSRIEFVRGYRP